VSLPLFEFLRRGTKRFKVETSRSLLPIPNILSVKVLTFIYRGLCKVKLLRIIFLDTK